ncbi:MAG TPA: hypothetical protein VGD76_05275 [Ramlibacter sp.]
MRLLPPALAALLSALATGAHAHAGHAAAQPWHWHATDTSGFVMVAVLAGLAFWLSRGE